MVTFDNAPDFEAPGDQDADNTYDIQVTVTDSGALTDVQDIAITVTNVDDTAPVASPVVTPTPNAAGWNTGDATITWNWVDEAGGSGLDLATCSTTTTVSGDGTFTITRTCQDFAGNTGTASVDVKIDSLPPTAAPVVTPTPNAAGWHNSDVTVTWNWADEVGGSGLDSATCSVSTSILSDGTFTITRTCTDIAGNTGTASVQINIDQTAPDTTLTATPLATVVLPGTNTFEFTGSDDLSGVAAFECQLDGGGWTPCTSANVLPQLPNGDHTFEVRAIDIADNTDASPAPFTWTVDIPTCMGHQATIVGSGDITGTAGADVIVGSEDRDVIDAGDGDDTICSLGGDDTLKAENGDDTVDVGSGNDVAFGGGGDDTLMAPSGNNRLEGQGGNDALTGGGGNDTLNGGGGRDTLLGNDGDDTLNGGGGRDNLNGRSGDDTLNGGGGNDVLRDGIGDDTLNGGSGNDTLYDTVGTNSHNGAGGFDRCTAGPGDTVVNCEA